MSEFEQGYALIIGVGADLPNTVDDARGVADILQDKERCAYVQDNVQLLTGPEAARQDLLAALDALAGAANEQATVIVYFSGHGYRIKTMTGSKYFIMPHGYDTDDLPATAVSGDELAAKLEAIPAQKLLLLLDCCHAGGLDDIKTPGATLTKAPIPEEVKNLLGEGRGRAIIASSQADEYSYAGTPYSAFTLALIEALCGEGAARQDGFVRVADLALHTRQMVPQRTGNKQHPTLNYEQADNFRVAYYAAGDTTAKGLPFDVEPQIEPQPGAFRGIAITKTYNATADRASAVAQDHSTAVASRGVNVGGSVAGSIVTGDNNIVADRGASVGISGAELEKLFEPILAAVSAAPQAQQPAATQMANDLQVEAAKGEEANDGLMAGLIRGLVGLVPGAAAAVVSAFGSPILAGIAGPVTQSVLQMIQG